MDPVVDSAQGIIDAVDAVLPDELLQPRVIQHRRGVTHDQEANGRHFSWIQGFVLVLHLLTLYKINNKYDNDNNNDSDDKDSDNENDNDDNNDNDKKHSENADISTSVTFDLDE